MTGIMVLLSAGFAFAASPHLYDCRALANGTTENLVTGVTKQEANDFEAHYRELNGPGGPPYFYNTTCYRVA